MQVVRLLKHHRGVWCLDLYIVVFVLFFSVFEAFWAAIETNIILFMSARSDKVYMSALLEYCATFLCFSIEDIRDAGDI